VSKKTILIALAAAVAATLSISAAQAGMNNVNFAARSPNAIHNTIPSLPDVKVKPQMIDARLKVLHCYHTRERNELGVWVHRTHCN
jgi:hypothetical protein